jgi:acetyl esterase/lipase
MRKLPRRVRFTVVGAVTVVVVAVVASSVLLLTPALAGAGDAVAPGPPTGLVSPGKTTLTYCDDGGVTESLDVYEPDPLPSSPVPAVVYVHGGGWVQGDSAITADSLIGQVASAVEAKGWVFVSIDYRLAPRFRWPAQIDDAACAIRFLRTRSTSLHIDPFAIGAIGDSAGGQIVSLLGLAGRDASFDTASYTDQSSGVQAVVDLYGPTDLTTADWADDPLIQVYAPQAFGVTLGPGTPGSPTTDALIAASPVTYVGPHEPPFLIVQGAEDTVVPPDQSTELAARLRAAGDSALLVMVDHAQHGLLPVTGGPLTPPISQIVGETVAFLTGHLQPTPARSTRTPSSPGRSSHR